MTESEVGVIFLALQRSVRNYERWGPCGLRRGGPWRGGDSMIRGLRRVMISLERVVERIVVVLERLVGVGRRILLLVLGSDDCGELVSITGVWGGGYNATTTTCSITFEGSEDMRVNVDGGDGRGAWNSLVLMVSMQGLNVGRNQKIQDRDEDLNYRSH